MLKDDAVADFVETTTSCAPARPRGRPRSGHAKTDAERSKVYRAARKASGMKAIKCYLTAEQTAYLNALSQIHEVTMAEAIGLAVTSLIRGTAAPLK